MWVHINISCCNDLLVTLVVFLSGSVTPAFSPGLGLKRPYEDGPMDDKDLIKKMKRNLRKGTKRKNNGCGVLLRD